MSPRRRRPRTARHDTFWGSPAGDPSREGKEKDKERDGAERAPVRATPDPGAVARSLGEPPLLPPAAAEYQLQVVYEEAVKAAVGLAAANGLLAPDEGEEEAG